MDDKKPPQEEDENAEEILQACINLEKNLIKMNEELLKLKHALEQLLEDLGGASKPTN